MRRTVLDITHTISDDACSGDNINNEGVPNL